MEKAREFQKNIYFCLIDYAKAFDCVGHNTLWKILKYMGVPDHLTCLLRDLYACQKGTHRGCLLSPCLFNFYAGYIMQNARMDETQAGIKIVRRNINNLRYTNITTLMVESEKQLKGLLMRV